MRTILLFALSMAATLSIAAARNDIHTAHHASAPSVETAGTDTLDNECDRKVRYERLTEEDYREVADSLGVEVAAIKAVVDIEAGKAHKGFWSEGKPLINFSLASFRANARKYGINLTRHAKSHAVVFASPNARKYGSQQAAQQARLDAARTIDDRTAIESTYWGMFQIGGASWRQCGADDIDQFVELMSRSERDQLDLFANFIRSYGMVDYLKNKDWAGFARRYNGSGYRKRGYHTRMAEAYRKYKAAEKE